MRICRWDPIVGTELTHPHTNLRTPHAEEYVYLHNRQSRAEGRRIPHFLARVIGVHLLQNWCLHKRLHSYYDVPVWGAKTLSTS